MVLEFPPLTFRCNKTKLNTQTAILMNYERHTNKFAYTLFHFYPMYTGFLLLITYYDVIMLSEHINTINVPIEGMYVQIYQNKKNNYNAYVHVLKLPESITLYCRVRLVSWKKKKKIICSYLFQ